MFFEVIPTEVFRAGGGVLTYSSDQPLLPGHLVLIPLGRRTILGVVKQRVASVDFPTKPILRLLHPTPIPLHLIKSALWLSDYYLSPLPQTMNLMLPAGLLAKTAFKSANSNPKTYPKTPKSSPKTSKTATSNPKNTKSNSKISKTPSKASKTSNAASDPQTLLQPQNSSQTSKIVSKSLKITNSPDFPHIELNPAQQNALEALYRAPGRTKLLHGVTGSGKTNIYLKMTQNALKNGQSVILLVPEIALTSQLVQIFESTFDSRVRLIHSNQTLTERRATWLEILTTTSGVEPLAATKKAEPTITTKRTDFTSVRSWSPDSQAGASPIQRAQRVDEESATQTESEAKSVPLVIIGPRSALFAPLHNLGLIIIDEAHETAYYQENTPRYSALRLASFIANTLKISTIFGTATPNIVDYHLASTHSSLVELTEKAKSTAITPDIKIIDLKDRTNFIRNRYFSDTLLAAIEHNLKLGHQTLIFHNRRGSSPLTICEECGWQALCPNCYLPLTLHADNYVLSCHICGYETKVPSSCPACHHPGIIHKGFGTKLLESELTVLFPKAKIARFDGDNTKSTSLPELYQSVKSGEFNLLIGTQTLARGFDLPLLATVGIIQADSGLALPDFAAEERTYELLNQVVGRVGRGHLDHAEVIVQTFQPDHPAIQTALASDFSAFAKHLLKSRRSGALPPFTYLARLSITYKTEKNTLQKIRAAYTALTKTPGVSVSPPLPAFHERTTRGYTWQLIIKSTSRGRLQTALRPFAQFRIELDPPSLL